MAKELQIIISSTERTVEILKQQRDGIEQDVDTSIASFVNNDNKNFAGTVLTALKTLGKPRDSFKLWKKFMQSGDETELSEQIRKTKIPFIKIYGLLSKITKDSQRQQGKRIYSPLSIISRAFNAGFSLLFGSLMANNNRGGLNFRQQAILDGLRSIRMMYEGPAKLASPLSTALAPHLKAAVEDRMLQSYDDLKRMAGKPLIDEGTILGTREAVLGSASAMFNRLVQQSYRSDPTAQPTHVYDFYDTQMPEVNKFGVEFEGFTSIEEAFPNSAMKLAKLFQSLSLRSRAEIFPKQKSMFDTWGITQDISVVSPLTFTGRYTPLGKFKVNGLEIVSPILTGSCGQKELRRSVSALALVGFKSNETCGLHIHISLEGTTIEQKKNLAKALYANEADLDLLIDPARRGDNNAFAQSMQKIDPAKIDAAETIKELVEAVNPGKDRNYKFDITGLIVTNAPPTIQYRGAGGAGYLNTVGDYAVILGNFTQQALENPNIRVTTVIEELVAQRDALATAPKALTSARAPMYIEL